MTIIKTLLLTAAIQASALNLEFKRFTSGDGFPMVSISGLSQDRDGNIWISNNESGAIYKFDGFSSPIYFSESFKKAFGCTPKEYAKTHKK